MGDGYYSYFDGPCHVKEDIIKSKMPDKVVERLEGNIWEYERGIRR